MYDTGSTAFMLVCAMLVLLMTPGLAFFYGGLSRRKNVVNTMIMVFSAIGIVAITWTICGWSLAYGGDGSSPFFGGFDQLGFLGGVTDMLAEAETVPEDATYPSIIDFIFQMAFCMITTAIITGSLAGRMKFGAVCAFVALWTIVVYPPLAHMVWGGDGSLIGDTIGALDFAGGDVVHISSGLTGLILCLMLGKRKGFGMMSYRPHNVPFVALGATLLWFGWFGFNAGSALAANALAGHALVTTHLATAAGIFGWMLLEYLRFGKATTLGAISGALAGLVSITPAAGFVGAMPALVIGFAGGMICYGGILLKNRLGYDDALDVVGIHGVGGTWGAFATGLFASAGINGVNGLFYGNPWQLVVQVISIVATWSFVYLVSRILLKLTDSLVGLRVDPASEIRGLDLSLHNERGYTL